MPSHLPFAKNLKLQEEWRKTLDEGIIRSPLTPIDIPSETLTTRILSALDAHSKLQPDLPSIIEAADNSRSSTAKEIRHRALSFASFLLSRGFQPGEKVTAAIPNCVEWPVFTLGIWAVRGVVVGSSALFKLFEAVYQLDDSESSVVITSEELLPTMLEAVQQCPRVKTIVCVRSSQNPLPESVIDFEDTLKFSPLEETLAVQLDDICMVYYSSGTTGNPKGVIHTHTSFHCCVEMIRSHWEHEIFPILIGGEVDWYNESHIITSAAFHILGFMLMNVFLLTGSPMVVMKSFDGSLYLSLIEKFKPRMLLVAPAGFSFLAKDPIGSEDPLASAQLVMCSTAPLSQELSDEFLKRHPHVKYIVQGYGMTEMGFSHLPVLLDEGANASGGIVGAYFEQKIMNLSTGKACKLGERGEICVRGPGQTIGYLNREEATLELIDDEGWVHTGDIGYNDERGFLYIVDRLKELIKVNYHNQTLQVPPAELEGVLLSHPKIRDAAIVGIPDSVKSELVRAFIVKSDESLTEDEVKACVAEKLAEFKKITGGVFFIDKIPRSHIGKIQRKILRDVIAA